MTWRDRIAQVVTWLLAHRLMGSAILSLSLALAVIIVVTGPDAEPQVRTEKAWPVSVVVAKPEALEPILNAYGKVESNQVANLKTSVGAPVAEVMAYEGTWVEAGELLVRMDARELTLAVRRAESEYKRRIAVLTSVENDYASAQRLTARYQELANIAESKLTRHQELYGSKMISDAILDEVREQASERAITLETHISTLKNFPSLIAQNQAMVAEARAVLQQAELELRQTEIRAPFAGRVMRMFVAPGDRILPGEPVVQFADYQELEIRASIPAQTGRLLRSRIDRGEVIQAQGEFDDYSIALRLVRLSGDIKPGQSGLDAFFAPVDDARQLDIGRVVNLIVTLPRVSDVVALPVQSIYENNRIYKVENGRLVGLKVEQVGEHLDDDGDFSILVRSPLVKEGDRLITTQLPRAITGLLVDPIDASKFEGALAAESVPVEDPG